MQKVFVGLSGGVDSAVSAALLKERGFDVTGVFIRIILPGYPCPAVQDRQEAMRVAAHLRIPFREINLSQEYKKRVFEHTMREYAQGRTPNPDTLCNREIKFGLFYDWAMQNGAEYIATGHYARINQERNVYTGVDLQKDQSYFLYMIPKEHLEHVLFPVGELQKSKVRELATKFGLPNAKRKDSQGLCFLGDISLGEMLTRELHPTRGDVLSESGQVIGTHSGVALYTLGQRHGFAAQSDVPLYVISKDVERNTITVSAHQFPNKTKTRITLADTNWIGAVAPGSYQARYRYRQTLIPATIEKIKEGKAEVTLLAAHYAPEGQSLVLYKGERCLGGGVIQSAELA
jgi:tRNA-specific 2-thiouridylase